MSQKGNNSSPEGLAAFMPAGKSVADNDGHQGAMPHYAVEKLEKLGLWSGAELSNLATGQVSHEAVLPPDAVRHYLTNIYKMFGIKDKVTQKVTLNTIIKYFVINGTSSKARPNTNIVVQGMAISMNKVVGALGQDVRRFARYFADLAYAILDADEPLATELSKLRSWPQQLKKYCFDFSLFCKDLTMGEATAIRRASSRTIAAGHEQPGNVLFEQQMFEPLLKEDVERHVGSPSMIATG